MDSRVIQIAEGGVFKGSVGVDRAEIRGTFDGEMTVRDRLVVHATGRVAGKVRYGRMAIEEGGEITGDVAALPRNERVTDTAAQPQPATESRAGTVRAGRRDRGRRPVAGAPEARGVRPSGARQWPAQWRRP